MMYAFSSIHSKLRNIDSSGDIANELREILLQDQDLSYYSGERRVEALEVILTELEYGNPFDAWRATAFRFLWEWARDTAGLDVMEALECRGRMISNLVSQFLAL